jgi:hypothetical protein
LVVTYANYTVVMPVSPLTGHVLHVLFKKRFFRVQERVYAGGSEELINGNRLQYGYER